jgi:hypothetical protein
MEPAALAASIQFLKDAGLKIQHLVTDRSSTVRAMLRERFPEINNQADPWHYIKVCMLECRLGVKCRPDTKLVIRMSRSSGGRTPSRCREL